MERHHPKLNQVSKQQGLSDAPARISLAEIGIWATAFAVAWSAPSWIGESAILVSFYGIIAFMSWRLRRFVPFGWALLISVALGLMASQVTMTIFYR